eukprot:GHVU01134401.1.p1 GENE.GHVU01134401.1~~GHVU01134401.1.p1  ORF type:complete len:356 (+),score=82.68 GHVU01134401.1:264-1331(+)
MIASTRKQQGAAMRKTYTNKRTTTALMLLLSALVAVVAIPSAAEVAPSNVAVQRPAPESEEEFIDVDCFDQYKFPNEKFEQKDNSKVYLKVATLKDDVFAPLNITKYLTVFGVRVQGHKNVSDDRLLHVGNVIAQLLDANKDGKVDSLDVQKQLLERHATLFLMPTADAVDELLVDDDEDTVATAKSFPLELKVCPFYFDFEDVSKIQPGATTEVTCPEDLFKKDRTVAFVSDHIMGRGWPLSLGLNGHSEETELEARKSTLETLYETAVERGVFLPEEAGCPEDDMEYCTRVMFASWALTARLNADKCWCGTVGAFSLCTKDEMEKEFPELLTFVTDLAPAIPDGKYKGPTVKK